MKFRPLQDRLLVKRVTEEQKTKGGIIIPDTAKEKPVEGTVISAGNGKVLEGGKVRPLDVKAGDRILFGKYSGTEIKIDGEEHLVLCRTVCWSSASPKNRRPRAASSSRTPLRRSPWRAPSSPPATARCLRAARFARWM